MKFPVCRGVIDWRILVNYRVDPSILAPRLPAPFRPKLIHGHGMAGICLIKLKQLRPAILPAWFGISSENAAHRIAVEWDDNGEIRNGVYVERRDSNSWISTLAGGRLFPGYHHHARTSFRENGDHYHVDLRSDDQRTRISVTGRRAEQFPESSVFGSLQEASQFFEEGSLGYSGTPEPGRFQGLEMRCFNWAIEPLAIEEARSSFFEDEAMFPMGSVELDCGLLMRGIDHEWHARADMSREAEKNVLAA